MWFLQGMQHSPLNKMNNIAFISGLKDNAIRQQLLEAIELDFEETLSTGTPLIEDE